MSIISLPNGGWTVVATLEVVEHFSIIKFLPRAMPEFRFERAPDSPHGYVWINVLVDFRSGVEHAAHVAHDAIADLAAAGITDYRIVYGGAYLALTSSTLDEVPRPNRRGRPAKSMSAD